MTTGTDVYISDFIDLCEDSASVYSFMPIYTYYCLALLNYATPGDQSLQYIALIPEPDLTEEPDCSSFSQYAQLYKVTQQPYEGTWSITRGGIQLINGSCNSTSLPPEMQLLVTNNAMFLSQWYMPSLIEFLGAFATTRNQSQWKGPYMATGVAAMLWSRITSLDSAANLAQTHIAPTWTAPNRSILSFEDIGVIYPVDDTVIYTRPTLRKSGLLYSVLVIQPVLTLIAVLLTEMLHSTPLDRGFGLISILSGIDRKSLDCLAGAALSGELTKSIKLVMRPSQRNYMETIEYEVMVNSTAAAHNESLGKNIIYY